MAASGVYARVFVFCVLDELCDRSRVRGMSFYDARHWEPGAYWEWQDSYWMTLPTGEVTIGPLEAVRDGDGPARADER